MIDLDAEPNASLVGSNAGVGKQRERERERERERGREGERESNGERERERGYANVEFRSYFRVISVFRPGLLSKRSACP